MPKQTQEQNQALGRALARRRLQLDLTQREIATRLGYRQASFITMVEAGRSAIPPTRLFAFIEAYQWPAALALEALRRLYPPTYELCRQAAAVLGGPEGARGEALWAQEVGDGQ